MNENKTVTNQCFEVQFLMRDGIGIGAYVEAPDAVGAQLFAAVTVQDLGLDLPAITRIICRACDPSEKQAAGELRKGIERAGYHIDTAVAAAIADVIAHEAAPILEILRKHFGAEDERCPQCGAVGDACCAREDGTDCYHKTARNALNKTFGKRAQQ